MEVVHHANNLGAMSLCRVVSRTMEEGGDLSTTVAGVGLGSLQDMKYMSVAFPFDNFIDEVLLVDCRLPNSFESGRRPFLGQVHSVLRPSVCTKFVNTSAKREQDPNQLLGEYRTLVQLMKPSVIQYKTSLIHIMSFL